MSATAGLTLLVQYYPIYPHGNGRGWSRPSIDEMNSTRIQIIFFREQLLLKLLAFAPTSSSPFLSLSSLADDELVVLRDRTIHRQGQLSVATTCYCSI